MSTTSNPTSVRSVRRHRSRVALAAAVLLAVLPALGCSGGSDETTTAPTTQPPPKSKDLTTADLLTRDGQFAGLLKLVEAADGESVVNAPGPITLLAPNTAAFDALGQGNVDAVLANPAAAEDALKRHVLKGRHTFQDLIALDGETVETVGGDTLTVQATDNEEVTVGGVKIIKNDIESSNGIIHVTGGVITGP